MVLTACFRQHNTCVRRYRDYEVEAQAEAARRVQQAAEAGQDRSPATAPEEQPSLVPLGLEGGCRCAHWPSLVCHLQVALPATAGPQNDDRQVSDDWKPIPCDSICVPGTRRTQHNIVGLAQGRLGVPVARLPGYSCLRPIGLGTVGSADPCLQQSNEADCRQCALFTSRDGAVGLIQVGPDASVSSCNATHSRTAPRGAACSACFSQVANVLAFLLSSPKSVVSSCLQPGVVGLAGLRHVLWPQPRRSWTRTSTRCCIGRRSARSTGALAAGPTLAAAGTKQPGHGAATMRYAHVQQTVCDGPASCTGSTTAARCYVGAAHIAPADTTGHLLELLSSMAASMNAEMVAPSQEDMAVNLCSFIDGDLLAAALRDRPREASQVEEVCVNGTPSLVYQLSLGMV